MAETATITVLDLEPSGRLRVGVSFPDGSVKDQSVWAEPGADLATLLQQIRQLKVRTGTTKGLLAVLTIGQSLDLTPPVAVDADPARTQWIADYRTLQRLQRAVTAGLLAADDKAITDQAARVKTNFLTAYVDAL